MLILRSILSIASLFFIGYPLVYYLLIKKSSSSSFRDLSGRAYIFFISFYTGTLLAMIYLMALSIASVEFSLGAVVIFSSVFSIFSVYLLIQRNQRIMRKIGVFRNTEQDRKKDRRKLINALFAFVVFLIGINLLVVVFFAFLFPIRFWDAISCWSLKGRAFFIDGSVFPFYTAHDYGFAHLSYPLYVPLLQTWIYIWMGAVDEVLVKVIFPIFYLSLVFILYYAFRQKFKRLFAVILVFILSVLPVVMDNGYIEYTNLVFSLILFLGAYYFYLYIHGNMKKANLLVTSALFFTILTQIRSEGILFLIVFLVLNMIMWMVRIFKIYKGRSKGAYGSEGGGESLSQEVYINAALSMIAPVFLAFFLMLPWLYIKSTLGLPALSTEWSMLLQDFLGNEQGIVSFDPVAAVKAIVSGLFYSAFDSARAFLGASYGAVWFVMLIILLVNFKRTVTNYNWIFAVFVIAGFISLLLSFSLIEEFIWSTDRYLLHLLPLTYFWIFYNLPLFENRKDL